MYACACVCVCVHLRLCVCVVCVCVCLCVCVCVCVCVVCVFVQWVNSGPRDKDLFHGQCPDRSVTGPMFAHDEADVLRPTHVRIN